MAGENIERMLGEISGTLTQMDASIQRWQTDHNARHVQIDQALEKHAADINQAKGAKTAILILGSAVACFVSVALAAAERFFR